MGLIRQRLQAVRDVLVHMHGEELSDRALALDHADEPEGGRKRLLVSLSPRVLSDSLLAVIDLPDTVQVDVIEPRPEIRGRYDVALVDAGVVVDAPLRIELVEDGSCTVVHRDGPYGVIDLRDAIDLVSLVSAHLGVEHVARVGGDVQADARAAAGTVLHAEHSAH